MYTFLFENGFILVQFKSIEIPECFLEIFPVVLYESPNKFKGPINPSVYVSVAQRLTVLLEILVISCLELLAACNVLTYL